MRLGLITGSGWNPPFGNRPWRVEAEAAGECEPPVEMGAAENARDIDDRQSPKSPFRLRFSGYGDKTKALQVVREIARTAELRPNTPLEVADFDSIVRCLPKTREAASAYLRCAKALGMDTSHVSFHRAVLQEARPPLPVPIAALSAPAARIAVLPDAGPDAGGLTSLLHPNDPKVKVGRQMGKARGELLELIGQINAAIAQTGTAASSLRGAVAQQKGVVAKSEQEARLALRAGGREAARPAGVRLLQAQKDLGALRRSLEDVDAQSAMLLARRDAVEGKLQTLETDALSDIARLDAAKARASAAEVIGGVDRAMGPLADTFEKMDAKARGLVLHAEALEGLDSSGVLGQVRGKGSATPSSTPCSEA